MGTPSPSGPTAAPSGMTHFPMHRTLGIHLCASASWVSNRGLCFTEGSWPSTVDAKVPMFGTLWAVSSRGNVASTVDSHFPSVPSRGVRRVLEVPLNLCAPGALFPLQSKARGRLESDAQKIGTPQGSPRRAGAQHNANAAALCSRH